MGFFVSTMGAADGAEGADNWCDLSRDTVAANVVGATGADLRAVAGCFVTGAAVDATEAAVCQVETRRP